MGRRPWWIGVAFLIACAAAAVDEPPDAVPMPAATVCPQRLLVPHAHGRLAVPCLQSHSLDEPNPDVRRAVIVIHGTRRNAQDYFEAIRRLAADILNGSRQSLLIAPQFPIEADLAANPAADDVLFWDAEGWKYGDASRGTQAHPRTQAISSFAVVDHILQTLADARRFPRLKEVVVAGHSAGGQFVNRYAAGSTAEDRWLKPRGVRVRYVVANPSTYLYLSAERRVPGTIDRFALPGEEARRAAPDGNAYPRGLDGLNDHMKATGAERIMAHMRERHVVYLVGAQDDAPDASHLDRAPAAMLQGATRRERAVVYHNHLRKMFGPSISLRHRFIEIPDVAHSAWQIFRSLSGMKFLFGHTAR